MQTRLIAGPARRVLSAVAAGAIMLAATPPATAAGWLDIFSAKRQDAQPVVEVQALDADRFNRLEAQLRTLTGQIEEMQFQLRQMQQALQAEGIDTGAMIAPQQPIAQPLPQPPASAQALGSAPQQQTVLAPATGGGAQPLDLSSLARGNGAQQQIAPAPQQQGGQGQVAALGPTGNPRADYQRGYDLILRGDYMNAEQAFRQFISAYPADPQAADAQYWIGESFFARGQYREAADEFLAGYKAYPQSPKGPDTLLKLGLSLAGLGERKAACSTYAAVLKQYPDASNALRQRVISERAVAGC